MKVLVVESEATFRKKLMGYLAEAFPHAEIHPYDPAASGRPDDDFNWARFDVLLLDYYLGADENGLDWLRAFKHESNRFPATILLTSEDNEEVAVKALRHGAHDYLRKQDLSPHKLAESVADALNARYRESSAETSLTLNTSKFSKSFFYGQLDLAFDEAAKDEHRALVLIRLDGYDALRRSLGMLAMEDVTRYLANRGMELFKFGAYRPRATRFSDASIGILIGGYESEAALRDALKKYCDDIKNAPPTVNDNPIPVTVSIGTVTIRSRQLGVYGLFEHAENAVNQAAESEGNSFVLVNPETSNKEAQAAAPLNGEFDVAGAVADNRLQAMFGAITAVSDRNATLKLDEFFQIDPHLISPDGKQVAVNSVFDPQSDESLARSIDRWSIGECLGRLLSDKLSPDRAPSFLIDVSEATSKDEELVSWLDEFFQDYGERKRMGELLLSVSPDTLLRHTKRVVPLYRNLHERHGLRFVLKNVDDPAMCKVCLAQFDFDLIILSRSCTESLIGRDKNSMESRKLLEFAVKKNLLTIARGIVNANALHAVISAGVDFVHGDFIAPEQEEVEAAVGIETVQIDDTGDWQL